LVHVVGLAPTKDLLVHLIYSQEPLLLGAHMHEWSGPQKMDEGREKHCAPNTLRGTLLPRMANSRTLAKHRVHHPEGSLPSSLANRYFDCQKTERAGFKLPREAARSFNSLEFCFWDLGAGVRSRELLLAMTPIYDGLLFESTEIIGGWRNQAHRTHASKHGGARLPWHRLFAVFPNRHHWSFFSRYFARPSRASRLV